MKKLILCAFFALCAVFCVAFGGVLEFGAFDAKKLKAGAKYLLSEKFDGVRGVWDGARLFTKRGNAIAAPACFTAQLPPFALDGELWLDYGAFEKIQSLAAKTDASCADWESVKYLVFDAPGAEATLSARLDKVRDFLEQKKPKNLRLIHQKILENLSVEEMERVIFDELEKVTKRGGEGLILRLDSEPYAFNGEYRSARSKVSFKVKPFLDAECEVVGHTQGRGKFNGMMGAILCKDLESNKTFKIGSGLSDALRQNPPEIGSIVTYKFTSRSKNNTPKHATFLRVRDVR